LTIALEKHKAEKWVEAETGIRVMDTSFQGDLLEPNDAELQYSERLVRLAHLPTYYYEPDVPPGLKSRKNFGLE
jgi:predicted O-linked N-acetylglucosamine transferase (SPINDLY family)